MVMVRQGWNAVPAGASAQFTVDGCPWWLGRLARIRLLERWVLPALVRRGCGWLTVDDPLVFNRGEAIALGWRVRPAGLVARGSVQSLDHEEGPH